MELLRVCKLKKKSKECPNPTEDLYNCWNPECSNWMHQGCCNLLYNRLSIKPEDQPTEEDNKDLSEPIVFCTKKCFLKWQSSKKKLAKEAAAAAKQELEKDKQKYVTWEEEGTMPILLDWLTTQDNYSNYLGGLGNKGKNKTYYHKLIANIIKEKKPESERTEKDVENKINTLHRQFRRATDWANNTGVGVRENEGEISFKQAMIHRCKYYYELEEIMSDRPSATPLASNEGDDTDPSSADSDDDSVLQLDNSQGVSSVTNTPSTTTSPKTPSTAVTGTKTPSTTTAATTTAAVAPVKPTSKGKKRISTGSGSKGKVPRGGRDSKPDDIISSYFGDANFTAFREREVVARETEASARMLEAQATSDKSKKEVEILEIQKGVELLRQRKKLLDEGVDKKEVDKVLPLPE